MNPMDVDITELERKLDAAGSNILALMRLVGKYDIPDDGQPVETVQEARSLIALYIEQLKDLQRNRNNSSLEMEKRLYCAGAEFHRMLQGERERLSKCRKLFAHTADVLSRLNAFEKYQLLLNVQHYKDELRARANKLQDREIRVLIAGEMCAGKSTVLNLLMGGTYVSVGHGRCTAIPCEITQSTERKAILHYKDKSINDFEIDLPTDASDILWKTLRAYIEKGEVPTDPENLEVSGNETAEGPGSQEHEQQLLQEQHQPQDIANGLGGCTLYSGDYYVSLNRTETAFESRSSTIDIDKSTKDEMEAQSSSCGNNTIVPPAGVLEKLVVYWPIPFLQVLDGITIIDLPGIYDSEELFEVTQDISENADVFLFVIDNSLNDGVSEKRLLLLMRRIREIAEQTNGMFSPANAVFACNKWQNVDSHKRPKTFLRIHDKLCSVWEGVSVDQLVTLSDMNKEFAKKEGSAVYSCDFVRLFETLCSTLLTTMRLKTETHCMWLLSLLEKSKAIVVNAKQLIAFSAQQQTVVLGNIEDIKRAIQQTEKERQNTTANILRSLGQNAKNLRPMVSKVFEDLLTDIDSVGDRILQSLDNGTCHLRLSSYKVDRAIKSELRAHVLKNECIAAKVKEAQDAVGGELDGIIDLYNRLERKMMNLRYINGDKTEAHLNIVMPIVNKEELPRPISVMNDIIQARLKAPNISILRTDKRGYVRTRLREYVLSCLKHDEQVAKGVLNGCRGYTDFALEYLRESLETNNDSLIALEEEIKTVARALHDEQPIKALIEKTVKFISDESLLPEIHSDMRLLANIGSGGFSSVYRSELLSTEIAVKVVRCPVGDASLADYIFRELIQLRQLSLKPKLQQEHVVHYIGFSKKEADDVLEVKLAFEYCEQTLDALLQKNMLTVIDKNGQRKDVSFPGSDVLAGLGRSYILHLALQAAKGLQFLHNNDILHRDIKPHNFLLKRHVTSRNQHCDVTVKLCDFGLARHKDMNVTTGPDAIGTHPYNPPEIYRHRIHVMESDVYSFGLVIWELWYGQHVYQNLSNDDLRREKKPPTLRDIAPPMSLKDMLKKCWNTLPQNRPSIHDLMECLEKLTREYPLR